MSRNEGVLTTLPFSGEMAHTKDHPPILLSGVKKTGTGAFSVGLLLARDDAGEFSPYDGTNTLAGVCDEPCDADDATCIYLAHGTAKARLLTKGGTALTTADVAALNAITVYPLQHQSVTSTGEQPCL